MGSDGGDSRHLYSIYIQLIKGSSYFSIKTSALQRDEIKMNLIEVGRKSSWQSITLRNRERERNLEQDLKPFMT